MSSNKAGTHQRPGGEMIRLDDGTSVRAHVVDILADGNEPLKVAAITATRYVVVREEFTEWSPHWKEPVEYRFYSLSGILAWVAREGCTLPSSFISALESGILGLPQHWRATASDIMATPGDRFQVRWSLSYESADSDNCEAFATLEEASAFLGSTGVMMAIPGNSGSIRVGSVRIYSTHFTSSGIDRGDSHVNPKTKQVEHDLFAQIEALERQVVVANTLPAVATGCRVIPFPGVHLGF